MDVHGFTDLIGRHAGLLHKVAFAYCRDAADRLDVIQEITLQAWRARHRYDDRYKETTWLYRIAVNVAISWYRRERRHRLGRVPADDAAFAIVEPRVQFGEEIQWLWRSIDQLGPLDKALVLLYLDGHDHATTAEVMGISVSNVGTRLSRIKDKLRAGPDPLARSTRTEEPHGTR
jgi:RNA polymerase sigma-70 factor (ECF subfamily)